MVSLTEIKVRLPLKNSSNTVIQQAEDEEQIIKTCEDDEEMVEAIFHVVAGQNVN